MKLANPLESVFGMASNNTDDFDIEQEYGLAEVPKSEVAVAEGPPVDHKDEDDLMIEKNIDTVYDAALMAYENQTALTEIIEPRYAARNAEVAAAYLNIALAAANSRAKVKTDRKRANQAFVPYANGGKTTNNIVVADRNTLLKMINIDGDVKDI
jgi:hypothetical protein